VKYTVRFAHLKDAPALKIGDLVNRGAVIGTMGNTGSSAGAHLHLDVVEGVQAGRYSLTDIAADRPKPSPKQAVLFVDKELFGVEPLVTTGYADPAYYAERAKLHLAFDLVPIDRHETAAHHAIHWNRSMAGVVVKTAVKDAGYGNYISIAFEA